MTDRPPDPNEAAVQQWTEETSGFERVEAVVQQASDPLSAAELAEEAHVSEPTARKHAQRLVDYGVATAVKDGRTTRYGRDETHAILQRVRTLHAEHTREELVEGIGEMKAEVAAFRETYGVESPDELAIELDGTDGESWQDVSEWLTTERNLALAETTLAFKRSRDLLEA
jgi:DNA-binding transcriptional ArsR family regulator